MSVQPKLYVPGQDQKADKLAELYDKYNGESISERTTEQERNPKDPFGLKSEKSFVDDYNTAAYVAERLTKFFALCIQDFGLSAKAAMFAAELTSLNIFNAQDIPASGKEIDEARKAAYVYFVKARQEIPDFK